MLVNGIEAKVRVRLIKGLKSFISLESYNSRGENIASVDKLDKNMPDDPLEVNRLNIYDRLYGEAIAVFNKHLSKFKVQTVDTIDSVKRGIKDILEIYEKYKFDDIIITVPIELKSIELVDDVLEVLLECADNQVESITFNLRSRRDVVYKETITHVDIEYGLNFDSLNEKLYKAIGYSLTSPDMVIISNALNKASEYKLSNVSEIADICLIFKYKLEIEREEFEK